MLRFNPSKGTTAVPTDTSIWANRDDNLFQPLKGNNGRSDQFMQARTKGSGNVSTPQRKQRPFRLGTPLSVLLALIRFNPSKEATAVPTVWGGQGRDASYSVSTPQRKQRPFRLAGYNGGHSQINSFNPSKETTAVPTRDDVPEKHKPYLFQPLKGNNGRSDDFLGPCLPATHLFQPLKGNNGRSDEVTGSVSRQVGKVSTPQRKQRPFRHQRRFLQHQ